MSWQILIAWCVRWVFILLTSAAWAGTALAVWTLLFDGVAYDFLEAAHAGDELAYDMTAYALSASATLAFLLFIPACYVTLFVAPGAVTVPLAAILAIGWRRPQRWLVLRGFNRGWPNLALRRITRQTLSRFGHVYTLADLDIKPPWAARAWIWLGQLSLFSFRLKKIDTMEQMPRMIQAIHRTWLRNINWCLSGSRLFPITCDQVVWQACVRSLVENMTGVLIDASDVRDNILWEIRLCESLGVEGKVVYVVGVDVAPVVIPQIAAALGRTPDPQRLVLRDEKGAISRSSLEASIGCTNSRAVQVL